MVASNIAPYGMNALAMQIEGPYNGWLLESESWESLLLQDLATTLNECFHCCEMGKIHNLPFTKSNTIYQNFGDHIASDLVGPMQAYSVGGGRFCVLFKDVYSTVTV